MRTRQGLTILRLLLLIALIVMLGIVVYPMLSRPRETDHPPDCDSNLGHVALAALIYAQDHGDQLMPAQRWVDALGREYLCAYSRLKCPHEDSAARSSYGMNEALGGAKLSDIEDPHSVVLFYETAHPGGNPHGGAGDAVMPPRHGDCRYYAFADGYVQAVCAGPYRELRWR